MTSAARQIRHYRKMKSLSLRDLSDASGISPSQLSKIETGKAKLTIETAMKLAEILQVPAANFLMSRYPSNGAAHVSRRGNCTVLQEILGCASKYYALGSRRNTTFFGRCRSPRAIWKKTADGDNILVRNSCMCSAGTLRLLTKYYDPVELSQGDSVLFDADQPHAYVGVERSRRDHHGEYRTAGLTCLEHLDQVLSKAR